MDISQGHGSEEVRRAVGVVAALNFAYFFVECAVALEIHSLALFADSVDFLEDASINLLIFMAVAWTVQKRAKLGKGLALLLLMPAAAFLWALWGKFQHPEIPAPFELSLTALGAAAVNLSCALLLARFRRAGGSLAKAAFLSARNDVLANVGIIGAGLFTAIYPSIWPDLLVGLAIAAINIDAAREVWEAARSEERA